MKRILSIILAMALMLSVFSVAVFAEDTDLAEEGATTVFSGISGTASYEGEYTTDPNAIALRLWRDPEVTSGQASTAAYLANSQPWYPYRDRITSARFFNGISTVSTGFMCYFDTSSKGTREIDFGSVETIENSACLLGGITSVKFDDGSYPNLKTIENYAFESNRITSLVLPHSVQSIGTGAFQNNTLLKKVTLGTYDTMGDNATTIGTNAFTGCTEITDVYFCGTPSDWNKLNIKSGNECLTGATRHYILGSGITVTGNTYPEVGSTIKSSVYNMAARSEIVVSLQWQRSYDGTSWSNISGATGTSYTVTNEDALAGYLRVTASGRYIRNGTSYPMEGTIASKSVYPIKPSCTITFARGAHGSGTMDENQRTLGSYYELPSCTFDADAGYEFSGWKIGSTTYQPGNSVRIDGDTTVTAQWTKLPVVTSVNVTFTEPKAGAKPNYMVSKDELQIEFFLGSESGTGLDFFDKASGAFVKTGDDFIDGKTYTAKVYMTTEATWLKSTIDKNVKVYFNGKESTVTWVNEKWIYASHDFVATAAGGCLMGDVTGDGKVDNTDAVTLKRYVMGWSGYASKIKVMAAADLDGSGSVNNTDAVILKRCVMDWSGYKAKYIVWK